MKSRFFLALTSTVTLVACGVSTTQPSAQNPPPATVSVPTTEATQSTPFLTPTATPSRAAPTAEVALAIPDINEIFFGQWGLHSVKDVPDEYFDKILDKSGNVIGNPSVSEIKAAWDSGTGAISGLFNGVHSGNGASWFDIAIPNSDQKAKIFFQLPDLGMGISAKEVIIDSQNKAGDALEVNDPSVLGSHIKIGAEVLFIVNKPNFIHGDPTVDALKKYSGASGERLVKCSFGQPSQDQVCYTVGLLAAYYKQNK